MSSHVLGDKDVNASMEQQQQQLAQSKDVKSMDYHRQVFQSKIAQEPYVYRKATSASSTSRPSTTPSSTAASRSSSSSSSSRFTAAAATANTTNSSDTSSCSFYSPVPSLVSDSSSSSASPAPSITVLPRLPTNKTLVASTQQYVSPSDNIMSPCTAKINALRNKHVSKAKPKSLFAQASAKKLSGDNLFGSKSIPKA